MTRDRFPLPVASLVLAVGGCATSRTGGPEVAGVSAADADASAVAIKGTGIVSTGAGLSPPGIRLRCGRPPG